MVVEFDVDTLKDSAVIPNIITAKNTRKGIAQTVIAKAVATYILVADETNLIIKKIMLAISIGTIGDIRIASISSLFPNCEPELK